LRVLFYHRVADGDDELAVTPQRFAAQMDCLADEGLVARDVEEAGQTDRRTRRRRHRVVLRRWLLDVADHALPVLERHGFTATVFVPTGVIDGSQKLTWYDDQPPMLTWEQVHADRAGTLRFGAHTVTHPNPTAIDDDTASARSPDQRRRWRLA
jgi:peptidoglycan/xylan/chitin deacetylase (PgdA/CDA1 family)